jgi:hypothetical protein
MTVSFTRVVASQMINARGSTVSTVHLSQAFQSREPRPGGGFALGTLDLEIFENLRSEVAQERRGWARLTDGRLSGDEYGILSYLPLEHLAEQSGLNFQ